MGQVIKQTRYEVLPVGEYQAKIGALEALDGSYGPQLKFRFDLQGEHAGRFVMGWTSQSFTPKSKLYNWTKAAFGGGEIVSTYDLDLDDLLDRAVTIVLVTATGSDGSEFNKVHDVKPAQRSTRPAAAVTTPAPVIGIATGRAAPDPVAADWDALPSAGATAPVPTNFANPGAAIAWAVSVRAFADAAEAQTAYEAVKRATQPTNAAAMWGAWTAAVLQRRQAVPAEMEF